MWRLYEGLVYGLISLFDCSWLFSPYCGVKTENSFQIKNLIGDMCEGNQEGLTARIWQTTTLICFFTFLYVYVRRFMCVQIHVGGGWNMCTSACGGQAVVPRLPSTYSRVEWGGLIGLQLTKQTEPSSTQNPGSTYLYLLRLGYKHTPPHPTILHGSWRPNSDPHT